MKWTRLIAACAMLVLAAGAALAQEAARPRPGPPGTWAVLGRVTASHKADHDRIRVVGRGDDFRRLKFLVKDAPLNIHRIVVTYDRGGAEALDVRQTIRKGGESRAIDLRGGKRSIHTIEFWYDTKGWGQGRADVTILGLR